MIAPPGPVIGPELERIVSVVPFGFRLWDPVIGRAVSGGLQVTWRTRTGRHLPVSSSPSGVFALRHLPGNYAFEQGAGDDAFWANQPAGPAIGTVEVTDPLGRYLPFAFSPDGPARIGQLAREVCGLPAGGILGLSGGSPPEPAMPVLPLFSATSRIAPQGMARLSAQLVALDGTAAAGAVVRVAPPGDHPWYGVADDHGLATVLFPYPRPSQDEILSPPASAGGSHAAQHWDDVGVAAFWSPMPATTHPDLCDVLAQVDSSRVAIRAGGSPNEELTEVSLEFGVPLDVRTFPLSVLIVEAGSPPSP
jgi:hypothetical protein